MVYSLSNVSHKFRDFVHQSQLVHQTSLVAQRVKNLPTMQGTWVQTLGQEDPWRREWLPTPIILPGEFHGEEPGGLQSMGLQSQT